MNDFEQQVRNALDDRAGQAPTPHDAGEAIARVHRRRAVTVASGALGAAVLVVAVLLVASAMRSPHAGVPVSPGPTGPVPTPSVNWPSLVPRPPPDLPAQAQLEHGGTAWALYLAVARDPEARMLEEAIARAAALGYEAGVGELACDQPVGRPLPFPADAFAVALYFETQADAETVRSAMAPESPGGAQQVTTFCLD